MYVHRVTRRRSTSPHEAAPRWGIGKRLLLGLLVAAPLAGLAFYAGAAAQRTGRLAGYGKLLSKPLDAAFNYGSALVRPPEGLEHIHIDIRFQHYQKLLDRRAEALKVGFLIRKEGDYVPGQIRVGDETLPIKLRLKGDLLDHLRGDRWSFRVRVRRGEQFHGMRRFSLQHPRTRAYVWEWAVLEAMRREDVLSPRYGFLEVTLNGKPLGIYAYEEHFGKELLENQARRESVIVKFNESWRWEEMASTGGRTKRFMYWGNAPIDAFDEQTVAANPNLSNYYESAVANLEGFRQGRSEACDVFDCERVARLWAVADLMGASHALHWINLRYYFNPVTSRLEPIAFDCLGGYRQSHIAGTGDPEQPASEGKDEPNSLFMSDPRFVRLYVQALQRVGDPRYLESLRDEISDGVRANLRLLHREWPWEDFDWGVLESNRALIRSMLDPPAALVARFDRSALAEGDRLRLRLANPLAFPVEILGVEWDGRELPVSAAEAVGLPRTLPGKPTRGILEWTALEVVAPEEDRSDVDGAVAAPGPSVAQRLLGLEVRHRILGDERVRSSPVLQGPSEIVLHGAPLPAAGSRVLDGEYPFAVVDEERRRIELQPGSWEVEGDLVVPPGWRLAAGPGTTLRFEEEAVLLSYSPLELVGAEEAPVVLDAAATTWGGLQVIQAHEESRLEHLLVRNTAAVARTGWVLTGGMTLYESPFTLLRSTIEDAHGEDALNVIRSEFRIADCLIRRTAFDAVDIDFGRGSFERTRLTEIGNDAVDFSGSEIRIEDLVVLEAGDKGVSVGEASQLTLVGARIEKAGIGIASKDRSVLRADGCEIVGCKIAVTAFQKKPEYGGGHAYLTGTRLVDNETDFLVETGSSVVVDDVPVAKNAERVADALYSDQ